MVQMVQHKIAGAPQAVLRQHMLIGRIMQQQQLSKQRVQCLVDRVNHRSSFSFCLAPGRGRHRRQTNLAQAHRAGATGNIVPIPRQFINE